jgi:hypothetical protein
MSDHTQRTYTQAEWQFIQTLERTFNTCWPDGLGRLDTFVEQSPLYRFGGAPLIFGIQMPDNGKMVRPRTGSAMLEPTAPNEWLAVVRLEDNYGMFLSDVSIHNYAIRGFDALGDAATWQEVGEDPQPLTDRLRSFFPVPRPFGGRHHAAGKGLSLLRAES